MKLINVVRVIIGLLLAFGLLMVACSDDEPASDTGDLDSSADDAGPGSDAALLAEGEDLAAQAEADRLATGQLPLPNQSDLFIYASTAEEVEAAVEPYGGQIVISNPAGDFQVRFPIESLESVDRLDEIQAELTELGFNVGRTPEAPTP